MLGFLGRGICAAVLPHRARAVVLNVWLAELQPTHRGHLLGSDAPDWGGRRPVSLRPRAAAPCGALFGLAAAPRPNPEILPRASSPCLCMDTDERAIVRSVFL